MNEHDYGVDWQEYSLMATNNVNDTHLKKNIYIPCSHQLN